MKKIAIFGQIILLVLVIVSCNNNSTKKEKAVSKAKATNLEELKEKYSNYDFKDCDEFLAAGDEMIDVYIETIDRAYEGDSLAKKDLDRFDTFMNQYDAMAVELSKECPDQFEAWAEKTDVRVSEASEKLFEIYMLDYNPDAFEFDEELEKELEEEMKKLNEQVEKVLSEDALSVKN